jgi:hypothetical protein
MIWIARLVSRNKARDERRLSFAAQRQHDKRFYNRV